MHHTPTDAGDRRADASEGVRHAGAERLDETVAQERDHGSVLVVDVALPHVAVGRLELELRGRVGGQVVHVGSLRAVTSDSSGRAVGVSSMWAKPASVSQRA